MGLTLGQARSIGLGHLHPAVGRDRSAERELAGRCFAGPKPAGKAPADGMSMLERRFRDDVLEPAYVRGSIARWQREPVKLRLAGRTYYSPDFLVTERAGEHGIPARLVFVETKGYMRDDASVKLKVAAATYPQFGWLLVTRDKWGWHVRRVDGSGIGRDDVHVPWIYGGI